MVLRLTPRAVDSKAGDFPTPRAWLSLVTLPIFSKRWRYSPRQGPELFTTEDGGDKMAK